MGSPLSRRNVLSVVSVAVTGGVAGCVDGQGQADTESTQRSPTRTSRSRTTSPTESTVVSPDGGLDLREANVTGVVVEATNEGYRFDVTLYHDDDGEDGYANWWQVETLDGDRLGRRTLLHAHGTHEFTRSDTFEIPADIECVVVRGHDQTHGYGGQAMLVTLETGETRPVQQGADARSVSDAACP